MSAFWNSSGREWCEADRPRDAHREAETRPTQQDQAWEMRAGDDGVPPGGGGDGGRKRTAAEEERLKRRRLQKREWRAKQSKQKELGGGRVWKDLLPEGKRPKYGAPARTVTPLVPEHSRPTPPPPPPQKLAALAAAPATPTTPATPATAASSSGPSAATTASAAATPQKPVAGSKVVDLTEDTEPPTPATAPGPTVPSQPDAQLPASFADYVMR